MELLLGHPELWVTQLRLRPILYAYLYLLCMASGWPVASNGTKGTVIRGVVEVLRGHTAYDHYFHFLKSYDHYF